MPNNLPGWGRRIATIASLECITTLSPTTKAKETLWLSYFLSSRYSAMTPECMIEMAHLHMEHLGSFSFTSFLKTKQNREQKQFHNPTPFWPLSQTDSHETVVASTRGWNALCTLVVSLETTTQEYHDYTSHCTWQPQRWQMSLNRVPACGELHPPGTQRSTFSSPRIARSFPSIHFARTSFHLHC